MAQKTDGGQFVCFTLSFAPLRHPPSLRRMPLPPRLFGGGKDEAKLYLQLKRSQQRF